MKAVFFNILVMVFFAGCKSAAPTAGSLDTFKFLLGQWEFRKGQMTYFEQWHASSDHLMQASSYILKDGKDTVHSEQIKLVKRDGDFYFIPHVSNQNNQQPVEFKIVNYNDSSFVATNPQHDFPKRIRYLKKNKDYMVAYVDDGLEQPKQKIEFHFIRKFKP